MKRLYARSAWVDVSDRMPDEDDLVIIAIHDGDNEWSVDYCTLGWQYHGVWVSDNVRGRNVVAWMPLPPFPRKDK